MVKVKELEEFFTTGEMAAFKGICEMLKADNEIKIKRTDLADKLFVSVVYVTHVLKTMKLIGLAKHKSGNNLVIELTNKRFLNVLLRSWENE